MIKFRCLVLVVTLIQCQIGCERSVAKPDDDPGAKEAQKSTERDAERLRAHHEALRHVIDGLMRTEIAMRSSERPEAFQPKLDELTFAVKKLWVTVDERSDAQLVGAIDATMTGYGQMMSQWRTATTKLPNDPNTFTLPYDSERARRWYKAHSEITNAIIQLPEAQLELRLASEKLRERINEYLGKVTS